MIELIDEEREKIFIKYQKPPFLHIVDLKLESRI